MDALAKPSGNSDLSSASRFIVGAGTDIGRKRSQNQDSYAVHPELGLFVVADGMGGHQGGETASAMAAEIIPEVVREALKNPNWNPRDVITKAIRDANNAIFDRACKTPTLRGMGTTTTAILFHNSTATIGHVGDSRCYFFHKVNGHHLLWQATRDHSLVQEKLRAGLITRAEIRTDRMKNVITRSVGFEREVNVELYELMPSPGDIFLICSDGLSGLVQDQGIQALVDGDLVGGRGLQAASQSLIDAANQNGGDDNITSILIQLQAQPSEARPRVTENS